ncbi:hypothetical protein GOBAR_DD17723 [Gossypium barbadense]|nr:hypothetical protein GOBAR_DD17723 [Gossypium barbadense]
MIKVGSFDAGYGSSIMSRLVRPKKAHQMWFLARFYTASKVEKMRLVNVVVLIPRSLPIIGSYGSSSVQGNTFPYGCTEMKISRRHRYGCIPEAVHYPARR